MKKKREAVRERIYLTFPRKQFDVGFNIRGSTVTAEMGLMALELNGETEVDKAVAWLKDKGVMMDSIEKNVLE